MKFWKIFIIFTLGFLSLWMVDVTSPAGVQNIWTGIINAPILAALVAIWIYAAFTLIDSENLLYQLVAVIMTGLVGILGLLGIRWVYRKMGFTFLD